MAGALRMTSGMLSQGLVSFLQTYLLVGSWDYCLFLRVNNLNGESDSF